ncbi:O-methyltransferase involved in polyketide biosynthesis [Nonomuraea thailandensis]|uniref:O-methyltransferase involved in polyketide biosynthesis n=1 Tax=Nonomuraea thailandensis TaxID=1188745 RepID=A0A9X2G6S4_9ACTN|nr:SAM-dependent methyltransferase [Nonomuraea thailandensis]MCP2353537.1 O-methyltransferase involved in polyketide biosynthesis [Nonomuraea thailandensis]
MDLPGVDPTVPSAARIYDYLLGGKDHFAADRQAAEAVLQSVPNARQSARANRAFLSRAVRALVEAGVRQFLDIGAGLPTQENVHQVAQRAAPNSRVVYVDNDPVVLVHARALLADNPGTVVVPADIRDPAALLGHPMLRDHLDFTQPVGVLLLAVLHFIPDDEEAARIVAELRHPLVSGSYVAISHGHPGELSGDLAEKGRELYGRTRQGAVVGRTRADMAAWLEGLELLDPGIVPLQGWRPEEDFDPLPDPLPDPAEPGVFGMVARVP